MSKKQRTEPHTKTIEYNLPNGAQPCGWAMVTFFRKANGQRGFVIPWSVRPDIRLDDRRTFDCLIGDLSVAVANFVKAEKGRRK